MFFFVFFFVFFVFLSGRGGRISEIWSSETANKGRTRGNLPSFWKLWSKGAILRELVAGVVGVVGVQVLLFLWWWRL